MISSASTDTMLAGRDTPPGGGCSDEVTFGHVTPARTAGARAEPTLAEQALGRTPIGRALAGRARSKRTLARPGLAGRMLVGRALFAEARRRRRVRLARWGVAVALASLAAGLLVAWLANPANRGGSAGKARAGGSPTRSPAGASRLVWDTSGGQIIVGNLGTLAWRPVTEADVDLAAPLVSFGGSIYWVSEAGGFVDGAFWPRTVNRLNPATGRSTDIGPGEYVFPSADGRRLYISRTDLSVAGLPAGRGPRTRVLNLPAGWYLPGGAGLSVADGIVVQSSDSPTPTHPARLAVWNPVTGHIRRLGLAQGAVSAWTPPGAGYSLLAWMPADCRFPACPLTITNTRTMASRTLRSPLGHGFVVGGAFSPDGGQLAVFVNASGLAGGQTAELAVASTGTGRIRLVPDVRLMVGLDADWARWLPGGRTIVTLANRDYLVDAATLAARPFRFGGAGHGADDVNFSAELLPPG